MIWRRAALLTGAITPFATSFKPPSNHVFAGSGLERRATIDDCFGPHGVCTIYTHEFAEPCLASLGPNKNYTAWAICKCETGWLSMQQASVPAQHASDLNRVTNVRVLLVSGATTANSTWATSPKPSPSPSNQAHAPAQDSASPPSPAAFCRACLPTPSP